MYVPPNPNNWRGLSNRELEIVLLMADGWRRENICHKLGIKYDTVRKHSSNIFEKLEVNSSLEVVSLYYKENYEPKSKTVSTSN